jgi:SAM-dependent methyltransferase
MENRENVTWPGLDKKVQAILRCPACQGRVGDDTGGLQCLDCQRKFPLAKGVLRFVDKQYYAGSFGFQWLKHDRTQLDNENSRRSEQDFIRKTGLTRSDLAGKLVLDVGCGMGRYAEVASRWGAQVVGIDLSQAVEAAARNLAERDVTIFQADVFSLPFAPESFDYIYSMGVLHHTPSCENAFKTLPRFLKPGGGIVIWLYSGYHKWYRASDFYRRVTRRMSPKLLHALCQLTRPLYGLHRVLRAIPLIGRPLSGALAYAIPMSFNRDPEWRILNTFDWYSPWYQSKHTYEEVFRWFESCGLEDLHVGGKPVAVRGTKPRSSAGPTVGDHSEVERCVG